MAGTEADLLQPLSLDTTFGLIDPAPAPAFTFLEGERLAILSEFQESSEELLDAETLADNLLLTAVDGNVPDDEGQTVVKEEISFDIPVVENGKVRYFINYFTGSGRKVFTRWLERSGRYLPMMREIFAEEGLPLDLAYLAMVESGFNTRAYSWAHAVGPWQFIPGTGRMFGLDSDWWRDERRDFVKSTYAAARYLKELYSRFDDWYLAVASYNAGAGKIGRAIRKYGTRDFWELSRGSYLQSETKNYVPKLLAVLLIAKEPEKYGFVDLEVHEPLDYEVAVLPTTTDLEVVSRLCQVDYETIKELNPELKRWCTPPGHDNYELRIPSGTLTRFQEGYDQLPAEERANYHRHRVKSGDTLLGLAKKYHIRVDDIISLNRIRNPRALRIGTDLILPLRKGFTSQPIAELQDDYVRTRRVTYTVRRGDSLWSISRKFGVTEKQLRVWNRLGWSNTIRPGQVLAVSEKGRAPVRSARSSSSVEKAPARYTVRAGDSLWSIARRFGLSQDDIRTWNGLTSSVIRPGQVLSLSGQVKTTAAPSVRSGNTARRITYRVRPGDTLWEIGRRFDVATREIRDWNDLAAGHVLHPGEQLTLLVDEGARS